VTQKYILSIQVYVKHIVHYQFVLDSSLAPVICVSGLDQKYIWLRLRTIPFHIWRYRPFRALASLIRRLHSSLFSVLLHPLIPSSCNASLWTTSAHLVLDLPTGLWCRSFHLKPFLVSFLLSKDYCCIKFYCQL
jgi:hypothetical protein